VKDIVMVILVIAVIICLCTVKVKIDNFEEKIENEYATKSYAITSIGTVRNLAADASMQSWYVRCDVEEIKKAVKMLSSKVDSLENIKLNQ